MIKDSLTEEILSGISRHIQQKNSRSVEKVVKVSVAVHGLRCLLSATVQKRAACEFRHCIYVQLTTLVRIWCR
jgi:hypothetical protein